jgi:hypothetical protein
VEVVRAVMAKDRLLSVRMIAEETGLDKKCSSKNSNRPLAHAKNLCKTSAEKICLWSKKRNGWKFVRICWEDSKLSQIFC